MKTYPVKFFKSVKLGLPQLNNQLHCFETPKGIFYYSVYNHSIYNENKVLIEKNEQYNIENNISISHKDNDPYWLRISLGQTCNFDCIYCMQDDIGNLHEKLIELDINSFVTKLDKYVNTKTINKIDLWGGEPFLYWESIKQLMAYYDRSDLTWFISTNGSMLNDKHLDFFKSLEATVTLGISHDGPMQETTRGKDYLNNRKDIFAKLLSHQLDPKSNIKFSFNIVVNALNHNFIKINAFFFNYLYSLKDYFTLSHTKFVDSLITKCCINYNLIRDYDGTTKPYIFSDYSISNMKTKLSNYLICKLNYYHINNKLKESFIGNLLRSNLFEFGEGALIIAKALNQEMQPSKLTNCGVEDTKVLSMDIKGNILVCPHTSKEYITGSIEDLSGVKLHSLSLNRYGTQCGSCVVYRQCKSNCPIEVNEAVFQTNCKSHKAFYKEIQKAAFSLLTDTTVKYLGVVDENQS